MSSLLILAVLGMVFFGRDRFRGYWRGFTGEPESRQRALAEIIEDMRAGGITPEEVAQAYAAMPAAEQEVKKGDAAMKIFAWLGALFVAAGIGVYISMFWGEMSPFLRIFITLGSGLFLTVLSAITIKEGRYPRAIMPLVMAAAAIETTGWFVLIHELFPHGDDFHLAATIIFGIMTLQQGALFLSFRRSDILLTALFSAFVFSEEGLTSLDVADKYIALLLGGALIASAWRLTKSPHRMLASLGYVVGACWFNMGVYMCVEHLYSYHWGEIAAGLSFCSLAYGLRRPDSRNLPGLGFFAGSILFYSGLWEEVQHTHFELLFPAVAVMMLYGAAMFQSRALLVTSACAILGFIGYYSWEYFAHSAGWPVALIVTGLAFLGVSAATLRIKRRYGL